ncbi:MAG TPA: 4'-phosphopantetheinyl transferase superfamily protein [Parafilimonas sp.]|nr:4'-phosphopantetheinyl transferase superfamily protein [Parafilimonas sp.]
MISTGNDIVVLECTDTERTKQTKFYSRILSEGEIELFKSNSFQTLSFENFVWLAWSVKESVYKFHGRSHPHTLFAPTKIKIKEILLPLKQNGLDLSDTIEGISLDDRTCYSCEVNFDLLTFYTRSFVTGKLIFTVANNTECFDSVHWGIKEISDDAYIMQSREVRSFVVSKLCKIFLSNDISIEKAARGYPVIAQQKHIPLSFSHHGKFVGYAFVINETTS